MIKTFYLLLLVSYSAICSAGGHADSSELLLKKLAGLNSFSANFEQQLVDINGLLIQQSTGKLSATKPSKLFWETFAPFEQQIIADGETIWLYDADLLQVTTQAYPDELARTPAMLLIGETGGLQDEYHVYHESDLGESSHFILTAKNADNLYSKVSLTFLGVKPTAMTLFDTLQQETRIQFSDIALNSQLDPQLFVFTAPAGVDVIRHD